MSKEQTTDLLKFLKPFGDEIKERALWLREFVWDLYPKTNELITHFVSLSGMISAEKTVVASKATHMMPTLLALTASSMAAMKRLMKMW